MIWPMDELKEIKMLFHRMQGKHSLWVIYTDFLEMAAIDISQAANMIAFGEKDEDREKRYIQIGKKYEKEDMENFAKILGLIVILQDKSLEKKEGYRDILGQLMMELGLGNKWQGQFFTPDKLSRLMAGLGFDSEQVKKDIEEKGYVSGFDEACGAGVTMLSLANEMMAKGYNPQSELYVDCGDLDSTACYMAYIQLSLAGIPARVRNRDSLTGKTYERWFTPQFWLGYWPGKLNGSYKKLKKFRRAIDEVIRLEKDFEEKKEKKKIKKGKEIIEQISFL